MNSSISVGGPVPKPIKSVSFLVVLSSLITVEYGQAQILCERVFQDSEKSPTLSQILKANRTTESKIANNLKAELLSFYTSIENQYGPLPLKPISVGLKWEETKQSFLKEAGQLKDSNEQYFLIARLFHGFNDAHISVNLPSSLEWSMPFQTRRIDDKLYVTYVNEEILPREKTPEVGDELVAINGQSVKDYQASLSYFNSAGNKITDQTLFGRSFTRWAENRGIPLSKMNSKSLEMKFRNQQTGKAYTLRMPIEKTGVGLIGQSYKAGIKDPAIAIHARRPTPSRVNHSVPKASASLIEKFHRLFNTKSAIDVDVVIENDKGIGKRVEIGARDPFFKLPESYKDIEWPGFDKMDETFFKVGTFERDGAKVGFLRIPSYSPEDLPKAYYALKFAIHKLQTETDYLVIDQTSNPGGYVMLSDFVARALVGKFDPKTHLQYAVRPSQKFLSQFSDIVREIEANADGILTPSEVQSFVRRFKKDYARIYQAFQNSKGGKSLISTEISLTTMSEYMELVFDRSFSKTIETAKEMMDKVPPKMRENLIHNLELVGFLGEPQQYTKEVFMMINELDFSGGDATPAILQDYGRVTLIGERTAGAGGTVENFSHRANSEVDYSMTTSLMVRKGGTFVENYGVQPDIHVTLQVSDILDNYSKFFERNLTAIDQARKK